MRILVMGLVLLLPSGVLAQLRPPVARADFTIATGAFGKRHEERPRDDRFTNTAVGELIGGLYWTDHLKTEMSVAWTGEASTFDLRPGAASRIAGPPVLLREQVPQSRRLRRPIVPIRPERLLSSVRDRRHRRGRRALHERSAGADDCRHAAARIVAQTRATRPAAQESPSPDLWRRVAERIQPGTTVTVDMNDGSRFKGIFLAADASAMSVRPRTRVPEAVQQIPVERIAHVDVEPSGVTLAEAAAVGTGAGLGAFLGLLLLLTAVWDD